MSLTQLQRHRQRRAYQTATSALVWEMGAYDEMLKTFTHAALERQQRADAAAERNWHLARSGVTPTSVDERLSIQREQGICERGMGRNGAMLDSVKVGKLRPAANAGHRAAAVPPAVRLAARQTPHPHR